MRTVVKTETVEVEVPVSTKLAPELVAEIPHPTYPEDPVTQKQQDQYLMDLQNTLKRYKLRLDSIRKVSEESAQERRP